MFVSNSKKLRQKAVNLLYLIFLAYFFILIPSDFVDNIYHSNKSLEYSTTEINKINNTNTLFFLNLLKDEEMVFNETREKFIRIDEISNLALSELDSIKSKLIQVNGMNKSGYFNRGKAEDANQKIMIQKHYADSLFRIIETFKRNISDYITDNDLSFINEYLPTNSYQTKSDGSVSEIKKFFFGNTPLNNSVLNISHFQSRIQRIKIYTIQKIIRQLVNEYRTRLPFETIRVLESSTMESIGNTQDIKAFYEQLKKELSEQSENNKDTIKTEEQKLPKSYMYIESATDSIHPVGKPFRFNIDFDNKNNTGVKITIVSNQINASQVMTSPGEFKYFPPQKGMYKILFDNGFKKTFKEIKVIDIEPIIQNTKLPNLFIGIDNPVKIKITEYDSKDYLTATISDGKIFKKGDFFYARVNRKGIVTISVFTDVNGKSEIVAKQQFAVRELLPAIPYVNESFNGDYVKASELKSFTKMSLKTDEYLVDEEVYIAEFDFTKIYNNQTNIIKPIKNIGSSFNNLVLKAIGDSKSGDILIFSNIKTKSSLGTEKTISNISIMVQ